MENRIWNNSNNINLKKETVKIERDFVSHWEDNFTNWRALSVSFLFYFEFVCKKIRVNFSYFHCVEKTTTVKIKTFFSIIIMNIISFSSPLFTIILRMYCKYRRFLLNVFVYNREIQQRELQKEIKHIYIYIHEAGCKKRK